MSYEINPIAQRILLIEDNIEMAENIAGILELAQYDVICAQNGKEGVAAAQQQQPDLILCDIMMPELDGYGVFHILNHEPTTTDIPFIFLTAKSDKAEVREGMNLGADDYITKPFDTTDLLKVIEVRLKKSDSLKTKYDNDNYNTNTLFSEGKEKKEIERLLQAKPRRNFRKKEFIYVEGQNPSEIYFIEKGRVKTFKINTDDKQLITGIHQEGNFIGYTSLLDDQPYHETAEAIGEAEIIMISKQEFLRALYSSKDLARKFIKLISKKIITAEERLLDLAYQSLRQRTAGALLNLHKQLVDVHKSNCISICRKDISGLVGTATESLNRTLADFKEEGFVEIAEEGIRILNQPQLERLLR